MAAKPPKPATSDMQITLVDAPDSDIGVHSPQKHITQAIKIDLDQDMIAEIIQAKTNDKALRISFGQHPELVCGSVTKPIQLLQAKKARYELYHGDGSNANKLRFSALVTHAITSPDEWTRSTQEQHPELQAVKNSASSTADRVKKPNAKNPATNALRPNTTKSLPTSPGLRPKSASDAASRLSPLPHSTTSVPAAGNLPIVHTSNAPNLAFLHFLAMRPATRQQIKDGIKCSSSFIDDLKKYATPADSAQKNGEELLRLGDRHFKMLDIWRFPYPTENDRQDAIDNAVKAFDRMRLTGNDPLWQKLLPKKDRGKGIVLSKLNHLHQGQFRGIKNENHHSSGESILKEGPLLPNHREMLAGVGDEPALKPRPAAAKTSNAAKEINKRLKKNGASSTSTAKPTEKESSTKKRKAEDSDEAPKKKPKANGTPTREIDNKESSAQSDTQKSGHSKKNNEREGSQQPTSKATTANGKASTKVEAKGKVKVKEEEKEVKAPSNVSKPKTHARKVSEVSSNANDKITPKHLAPSSSPYNFFNVFSNKSTPQPVNNSDADSRRSSNGKNSGSPPSSNVATPIPNNSENAKKRKLESSSIKPNGTATDAEVSRKKAKVTEQQSTKKENALETNKASKLESLKNAEAKAWKAYYDIRIEVDNARVVLKDKQAEAWEKFTKASDLTKRIQAIEKTHKQSDTVASAFSAESSTYLEGKLAEVLPKYDKLYKEVTQTKTPSKEKVDELRNLDREVRELQDLCNAIKSHQEKIKGSR